MSDQGEISIEPAFLDTPPPPYDEEGRQQPPPPYSQDSPEDPEAKGDAAECESSPDTKPDSTPEAVPLYESSAFQDKAVRRAFVRKVFSILTLQLVFTFTVVSVFTFSDVVKKAVQYNFYAYISSFCIFAVVAIALSCCQSLSRRHPWNIVSLVIVTISLSYVVGTMASYHDTRAVIITMASTLAISFTIIAFSAQTRYDLSICHGLLLVLAVDLLMFGVFSTFYYSYIAEVCYGSLGALLYALFLMFDCQLMMGLMGHRLDPEEYVTAALMIYLDIMLIFIYLLGRR
ncbi:protein lifeguard 1 [Entelurus aequoreus]|uniref:protein lifeguard 1 n=1 Tax=Entelurus aequoreus TaxID=161455 RepID=UPI002B1DF40D|nr:protein lifeguard 1 [Entelurus aequoreus]XP_061879118.1 protein lifeguard 1 [Entelurus aequoreus]